MIVVVLLALIGLGWLGQGLGLLPGSVMTGETFWAWMGGVLLVGAGLIWWRAR